MHPGPPRVTTGGALPARAASLAQTTSLPPWLGLSTKSTADRMDIGPRPRVSNADLRDSLRRADALADAARQLHDPSLHRLLLAASCRLLDGALNAATEPHVTRRLPAPAAMGGRQSH